MTHQEHIDAAGTIHTATLAELAQARGQIQSLTTELASTKGELVTTKADLAKAQAEILRLEARVRELEAELSSSTSTTTSRTTTRRTTTLRTTTVTAPPAPPDRPHILDDRFLAKVAGQAVDLKRYVPEKTPVDRLVFVGPRQLRFDWRPSADSTDMRANISMRHQYGGGGTPRRDPVGSTRLYAFGILLPAEFKTDDLFAKEKCVTGQFHQGGGVDGFSIKNPPVSVEQINGIMRLVLSLPGVIPGDRINFPLGPPPRSRSDLLFRIKWSPSSDGSIECWRDGTLAFPKYKGPTCWSMQKAGQGLNPSIGTYNPGQGSLSFKTVPAGWGRPVVFTHWLIGDEANDLADMVA